MLKKLFCQSLYVILKKQYLWYLLGLRLQKIFIQNPVREISSGMLKFLFSLYRYPCHHATISINRILCILLSFNLSTAVLFWEKIVYSQLLATRCRTVCNRILVLMATRIVKQLQFHCINTKVYDKNGYANHVRCNSYLVLLVFSSLRLLFVILWALRLEKGIYYQH